MYSKKLAETIATAQASGDWFVVTGLSLLMLSHAYKGDATSSDWISDDVVRQVAGALNGAGIPTGAQVAIIESFYLEWEFLSVQQRVEIMKSLRMLLLESVGNPMSLSEDQYNVLCAAVDCLGRRYADQGAFSILASLSESKNSQHRCLACIGFKYLAVNTADHDLSNDAIAWLESATNDVNEEVCEQAQVALDYISREGEPGES